MLLITPFKQTNDIKFGSDDRPKKPVVSCEKWMENLLVFFHDK